MSLDPVMTALRLNCGDSVSFATTVKQGRSCAGLEFKNLEQKLHQPLATSRTSTLDTLPEFTFMVAAVAISSGSSSESDMSRNTSSRTFSSEEDSDAEMSAWSKVPRDRAVSDGPHGGAICEDSADQNLATVSGATIHSSANFAGAGRRCFQSKSGANSLLQRRKAFAGKVIRMSIHACRKEQEPLQKTLEKDLDLSQMYEVKEEIGSGTIGRVHRAIMKGSCEKQVALKVLKARHDREYMQRCRHEFEILQNLPPHPHIMQALGFHELAEGGCVLALEYYEGATLQATVRSTPQRKLPLDSVRSIGQDLFSAVAHLHAHQVLHRDIKPCNIMVSPLLDDIRLCDFNVAKHLGDGESLTPTGDCSYRAPEVLLGEAPSERSDVWSSGLCLYFGLFGMLPSQRALFLLSSEVQKAPLYRALKIDASNRPCATELATKEVWADLSAISICNLISKRSPTPGFDRCITV